MLLFGSYGCYLINLEDTWQKVCHSPNRENSTKQYQSMRFSMQLMKLWDSIRWDYGVEPRRGGPIGWIENIEYE